VVSAFDKFEFRKQSRAPSGFISWAQGEELLTAARAALSSAAKASREASQHFGNRHGQFANRYLEQVLMGQTEPGSYVVTAYAPPGALVAFHQPPSTQQVVHFDGIDAVSGRAIAQALTRSLGAAQEAVEHARRTDDLSGFQAGVQAGVSFELAMALSRLTSGADEADVTIGLDPAVPVTGEAQARFEFTGADAEVFSRAATYLAQPMQSRQETVEGRVYTLTQARVGSSGLVGVETLSGQPAGRIRIQLPLEDYHEALHAHGEDLAVTFQGRLEREGNLTWLYDARLVAVHPAEDERTRTVRASGQRSGAS
jgi:hypothetical protein